MKYIKIFMAMPCPEFEKEMNELGSYIGRLNDLYVDRGIFFECRFCEDFLAEAESEKAFIEDSQYFYLLFGKETDSAILQDFYEALNQHKEAGTPQLYTYFKVLPESDLSAGVKSFMDELGKKLQHYYTMFSHIDSVKLNLLLELSQNPDLNTELAFQDGKVSLDHQEVLVLDNIPLYSKNENIQKIRNELDKLNAEFVSVNEALSCHPEQRVDLEAQRIALGKKRDSLTDALHTLERDVLSLSKNIADLRNQENLTWRQREAIRLSDAGEYDAAIAILQDAEREKELEQAKILHKEGTDRIASYIRENRQLIETLKARGVNASVLKEMLDLYEKDIDLAECYRVEMDVYHDYANFLDDQKQYTRGIEIEEVYIDYLKRHHPHEEKQLAKACLLCGNMLLSNSCHAEAESYLKQAVSLFQSLCDAQPSNWNQVQLIRAYQSLASLLQDTLRYHEAEQNLKKALDLSRELAANEPMYFQATLADSCNSLAILFKNTKRPDKAEALYREALGLYRPLVKYNPIVFDLGFAGICNNLALLLSDTQRWGEAEALYREALEIYRTLAKSNPQAFNLDLADSCNNLALLLSDTQRWSEAEALYREALDLHRALAKDNPQAFNSNLATSYSNLATLLSDRQKLYEAEFFFRQALALRRVLANDNPMAFNSDLASSCYNLATLLSNTQRLDEAESLFREAIDLRSILAKDNPLVFNSVLAESCSNLAILLSNTQRLDEAEFFFRQALALRRVLANDNPISFNSVLASSCYNLAILLSDTHRPDEAEALFREALNLRRILAKDNPLAFNPDLARSCSNLAILLSDTHRLDEAESFFREALDLHRALAKDNPMLFNSSCASSCYNLALFLSDTPQRLEEAESFFREALDLYKALAKVNPRASKSGIDKVCRNLSRLLRKLGKNEEAEALYQ